MDGVLMKIDNQIISQAHPPYIIAELSGNHNGDINRAIALIDVAADAGCSAVKLQTYTAATMTLQSTDKDFVVASDSELWAGRNLYDLYEQAHTPWDWHKRLFTHAAKRGITIFSSPFDTTAVDFLESLNVCAYKIASFEITDAKLLRAVGKTKKPVIVSTGMATPNEIQFAVDTLKGAGARDIALLKCTSAYPAKYEDMNISAIKTLRTEFDTEIGLSDHTMGVTIPVASIAFGATIIEKHITLDRSDGGVDSEFSLEPKELQELVYQCRATHLSLGNGSIGISSAEKPSLKYRRSIYSSKKLTKGTIIKEDDIVALRPSIGMSSKHFFDLIGAQLQCDKEIGDPIFTEDVQLKK